MPEPRPVSISRASDALPDGWEIHVDSSGRPFYMHKVTKKTSWTLPSVDKLNQVKHISLDQHIQYITMANSNVIQFIKYAICKFIKNY